jgi:hypothetical protein
MRVGTLVPIVELTMSASPLEPKATLLVCPKALSNPMPISLNRLTDGVLRKDAGIRRAEPCNGYRQENTQPAEITSPDGAKGTQRPRPAKSTPVVTVAST